MPQNNPSSALFPHLLEPLPAGDGKDRIRVNGIEIAWNTSSGQCTFSGLPVALMWVDSTLTGLMAGLAAMVGPERFLLALQAEGRKSVASDWQLISSQADFSEGFAALNNNAAVAGWGDWRLLKHDMESQECVFRAYGNWEGQYQKTLGVCWGSGLLAGKLAGICSKLFNTNCWAVQSAFVAKGDDFDEFTVSPSERVLEDEIEKLLGSGQQSYADMAVAMEKLSQAQALLQAEIDAHKTKEAELSSFKDRLAQLVEDRTQELKQTTTQLQAILDSSPVGICRANKQGQIDYVNQQFTQTLGYKLDDIPPIGRWMELACPNQKQGPSVISEWIAAINQGQTDHTPITPIEVTLACLGGGTKRVIINTAWLNEFLLINFNDITERWRIEQREASRRHILEMVAKAIPLSNILYAIVLEIEKEDPSLRCSILLLDAENQCLITGAAPSLPEFYNQAVNGIKIGDEVGSCGTAAYRGERVIAEDLQTHPYWAKYKQLAQCAGLNACWSEPILSAKGQVLGTFAIYHLCPATPKPADIELITYAASIASIAIEHHQTTAELERQAHVDYLTGLANRRRWFEQADLELQRTLRYGGNLSILMLDIDHFKAVNDTYGHKTGDIVLQKLSHICKEVFREIDVAGRFGGEEFAILLPETDGSNALDAAERLRLCVESAKIPLENGLPLRFTISIGVASLVSEHDNIDVILNQADQALYEAKRQGRNMAVAAFQQANN